ncbi:hypothetical protein BDZ97DRAFT_645861 [Flammula alnicola]|nr:hypothetical protein BDZ97DRAFT_645861 [Flammula alnicola]
MSALPVHQFIALHIRRADFSGQCHSHEGGSCFPPLSAYGRHVKDTKIIMELTIKRDLSVSNVIVMSEEASLLFWDDVNNQGWLFVNHAQECRIGMEWRCD